MPLVNNDRVRLLVFDGGDIRCLSQLDILEEFLYRVQWKNDNNHTLLPCTYFDIIGGVGPAGIIVILLVVLRLSVQQAKDEFVKIWKAISAVGIKSSSDRADILEKIVTDVFKRHDVSPHRPFAEETEEQTCKGFVCAVSPESLQFCQKFRTYKGAQRSMGVTVMDALRATCATPALFPSVKIGPHGREQTFISGDAVFNNPIREAIKELCDIYEPEREVACIMSLGCGRSGVIYASDNYRPLDGIWKQLQNERTSEELEFQIFRSQAYYRFSVDRGMEHFSQIQLDNLGVIETHTRTYLQQTQTSQQMDRCIMAAEELGRIPLQSLYGLNGSFHAEDKGLPPLCAGFVMRTELMNAMTQCLPGFLKDSPNIMVLSGMGGSGKTQLVSKFARLHKQRFKHILFVDASTADNLKKGIISKVRSCFGATCKTLEEAIHILLSSERFPNSLWLLILDNADDPQLELGPFLPLCNGGFIIITTRNPTLSALSPVSHIKVDVMSEAEAVDTLLKSAGMIGAVTQANREDAMAIAKELGYLPVAVVQAGSFIMQRRCMDMYLTYLKTNRHHVLNMPAKAQLDSHYHGIYAALDVTLPNLSQRSQMLLGVLACVNYTGFPVALIGRAARKNFLYERHDLLERSSEIQETAQFLDEIFKPDGHWHELMLDDLLVELERYSLVTRIPNYSTMTLRFHRLVHAWMYDRISVHNFEKYQVAALRLLVCGTAEEDEDLYEHMSSHASALESTWKTGHVNDQAAMTTLLTWEGKKDVVIQIWEDINQKIMAIHGESHISRSRARLQLALSYGSSSWEQWRKTTTQIEHEVRLRTELCSRDHPATMEALLYLCEQKVQYQWLTDEDLALQKELILFWRNQDHDHDSNFTVKAMEVLAKMYRRLGQLEQAITVLTDVLGSRKRTRGDDHTTTIQTMELLAAFQLDPRRPTSKQVKRNKLKDILSSENLLRDIVVHRMSSQGPHHVDTLKAQTTLAEFYDKARLFEKAESIWRTVIEGWDTRPGINDRKSLDAMGSLAGAYIKQKRYQEATDIWTSIVQRIREKHGNEAKGTLDAMKSLARLLERQKRYAEACSLWVEVIAGHKKRFGVSGVTLRAMQSLAMARAKQGDNDAAILLWQQIILGLDALGQPYDEQKDKATESLAKLYEEEGRYGEAIASWKQIIKNHQSFGDNRARRARESLGNLYLKQTYSSEFSFKRKQVISTEDYLGRRGLPESGEVRRQRPLTNGRHVSTINNPTDKALESLAGLLAKREGTLHLREQRVETTARAQEPVQQNEVITVAVERIPNTEDIKKGWDGCTIQ